MFDLINTLPWSTLAALAVSVIVAALARGFSGFGAALIFMPLASAIVSPALAAPLLLIIDSIAALGMVPDAWRRADRREVATMTIGALAGVPAGAFILTHVDALALRWGIAAAIFACLALLVSGWRYRGRPMVPVTIGVGAAAGLMGAAAQVSGPPVVAYWLGAKAGSVVVRANIILYFALSTVITTIAYWSSGLLTPSVFGLALVIGPLYAAALFLGTRLFGLADEAIFRRICYGLIAAAALISLPLFDGALL